MIYRMASYRGIVISKRKEFHGVPKAYLFMIADRPFILESLARAVYFIDLNMGEK